MNYKKLNGRLFKLKYLKTDFMPLVLRFFSYQKLL